MEKILRYCIGTDVDKKEFKANFRYLDSSGKQKTLASRTFSNSKKGFSEFEIWIAKNRKEPQAPLTITMEATGVYHENLAWHMHGKGFIINIVLALKAKRYLQSLGLRSKNDKIDAQGLATMGLEQQLDIWQPGSTDLLRLRSLTRQHEAIQIAKTNFANQLEAVSHSAVSDPLVSKSLESILKKMDTELEKLKIQIFNVVDNNEELSHKWSLMESIKGFGKLTFAVVVAETGGFALFKNIKQLVCYSGYDVVENQSGSKVGKTRISKKGNAHIRRAMFMPAFNVVRFEEGRFGEMFERVFEKTKIKMKGYVAVQRKLLCLMYTLWKTDIAYSRQTNTGHSREKEIEDPLSGIAPQGAKNHSIGIANFEVETKKSSPTVRRATLDGLSGEFSTVSPLSGKAKIMEKSNS